MLDHPIAKHQVEGLVGKRQFTAGSDQVSVVQFRVVDPLRVDIGPCHAGNLVLEHANLIARRGATGSEIEHHRPWIGELPDPTIESGSAGEAQVLQSVLGVKALNNSLRDHRYLYTL